jgi:hypothetical protein
MAMETVDGFFNTYISIHGIEQLLRELEEERTQLLDIEELWSECVTEQEYSYLQSEYRWHVAEYKRIETLIKQVEAYHMNVR